MASLVFRDGSIINDFGKPFVVAELNTSHFGNLETAKEMIKKAKECGCSCVKFQSWSADSLYSSEYYAANPIMKRLVSKFALSEDNLFELSEYSKICGISFSSTPYSKREVDFLLEKCNVPFIKVASMDCNNYPFLKYIGSTGAPIVLSTGMCSLDEIRKAVSTIEDSGNRNICLLHCISIYPPRIQDIQLNNILGLRKEFPEYPIGFSDHSTGIEMSIAAVALGACLIEKHFTLDKSKIGMDNQMAIEPNEMSQLVKLCENVQSALGSMDRVVSEAELNQRTRMRRSIVAARDLAAGTKLTENDLDLKRPGTGMPPEMMDWLIGKTLIKDVAKDNLIKEEYIMK